MVNRHKVFISFHDADSKYKDYFVQMMDENIVDKSVHDGDIDDQNVETETIRQRIRDEFISDATVTIVLVGRCTWQRKHVDWEIGSSLRKTEKNPRCGLLGIMLPDHPYHNTQKCNPRLLPPRLADNCGGTNSYASIYDWTSNPSYVLGWIDAAFKKRDRLLPNNARTQFKNNRTGHCSEGWS